MNHTLIRALPKYLTDNVNFDDCPPGHRFGLYFGGWKPGWKALKSKTDVFTRVANALPAHSRQTLTALRARQASLASQLGDAVLAYPARLSAPLVTGLGNEHPLENGFAFLNPHGLPYLAGSGVKGVLRRAAEELANGEWGDSFGWDQTAIDVLFGLETPNGDAEATRTRGALVFWDLFFQPPSSRDSILTVEIMTPHHTGYLQGEGTPHANESPTPIPFLALPAGCEATLYVSCHITRMLAALPQVRGTWKSLLEAALAHAGDWLGFGAKTAVGYGRLALDPKVHAQRQARRETAVREQQEREAEAALAALPADERLLASLTRHLAGLPVDPRTQKPILQPTSGKDWLPTLMLLDTHLKAVADLPAQQRERLASTVKKRFAEHFKVEGKAVRMLKEKLGGLRGT